MNSIRRLLSLTLGAVCCALAGAGGVALYLILRGGLLAEFDQTLEANARALTLMTEQSRTQFRFEPSGQLMLAFERAERPDYFQLWIPNGSTLGRSPSLRGGNLARHGGFLRKPAFWNLTLPDGQSGRAIDFRFFPPVDDEALPRSRSEVTLVVARNRNALDRRLDWLAATLLLVGATMAAAMLAVVAAVVRRGLLPLDQLAERAAAIDARSLQMRFPRSQLPSELQPIATRLNDLLGRLETSFARERRFSADVAHELRTPIAELRSLAEVALKWPDDMAAIRVALQHALEIALQMESIATGLLALARCEEGLLALSHERVLIGPLIREVLHSLGERVRTKQLAISLNLPDEACWLSDPAALGSIVRNLISNAIEHGPAGSAITLRVQDDASSGEFQISNLAGDLVAEDLPHLFERFWQKDAARSSSVSCGLGLALARAYAESLGMSLRVELTSRGEVIFELSGASLCPAQIPNPGS